MSRPSALLFGPARRPVRWIAQRVRDHHGPRPLPRAALAHWAPDVRVCLLKSGRPVNICTSLSVLVRPDGGRLQINSPSATGSI